MARGYTVATAALAVGAPVKWVDNVLSHFSIGGVAQSRQGIARRISAEAMFRLRVIRSLSELLGLPMELAVAGAEELVQKGFWEVGRGLVVSLSREEALSDLESRLEYAVEAAPLPRRGRPPGKAKRGA